MLGVPLVLGASFAYLLLLFAVAWWADRRAAAGRSVIGNAWVYTLSIGVYCTAWTYFGSVGRAATSGLWFLPIYLGPTLAMLLAGSLTRRMVRIARTQRITSIADFIASRYGGSRALAALVTLIALVGILPYIALQLKAIASGLAVLTGAHATAAHAPWWQDSTLAHRHRAGRLHHRLRHAPPRRRRAPRRHGRGDRVRIGGQARRLRRRRRLRLLGLVRRAGRDLRARRGAAGTGVVAAASQAAAAATLALPVASGSR